MKRRFIFFLLFITVFFPFRADAQVTLQNGASQFTLPLYNFSDANSRIGTSVMLNYIDGNGLKVSERASAVGTGWELNAGGYIERIQHGEPDDQQQTGSYTYGTTAYVNDYYPNGFLYSEFTAGDLVNDFGCVVSIVGSEQEYRPRQIFLTDREQDVFTFSFNGRQGQFVIGKTAGTWEFKTLLDSKLKIEKLAPDLNDPTIRTKISGFKITDESGIQYIFKERELSEVMKYNTKVNANNQVVAEFTNNSSGCLFWQNNKTVQVGTPTGQFVVDKWYLSEIVNPYTNAKILFTYEDYVIDIFTDKQFQKVTAESQCQYTLTWLRSKGIGKRLRLINTPNSEIVQLLYSAGPRADLPYDRTLDLMIVYYDNQEKYRYNFSYGYFVKNRVEPINYSFPAAELPFARLCLQSVKKSGPDGTEQPPYKFSYYTTIVPAMFSYYHDHYGYTTTYTSTEPGQNLANTLSQYDYVASINDAFFRQVVPTRARDGILKTIEYPTGGTLTYEYEQNDALDKNGNSFVSGGVRVKKTIVYDGIDATKNIVEEYTYTKENGTSSGWLYEPFLYSEPVNIDIYDCSDGYPGQMFLQTASLSYSIISLNPIGIFSSISGLVKLMSIETIHHATGLIKSSEPLNSNHLLPYQYSRVEVMQKSATDNNGKTVYAFTDYNYYPLIRPTPLLPYSSVQRQADWAYGLPKVITTYDKTGRLLQKTENDYNINSDVISGNAYASQKWAPKTRIYGCEDGMIYYPSGPLASGDLFSRVWRDVYWPLHGRTLLWQTREYTYNENNEEFVRTTHFDYTTFNDELRVKATTDSKGEWVVENYYYPEDYNYNFNATIDEMKNRGISFPLATYTYMGLKKVNNTDKTFLVKGEINEYGLAASGDLKLMSMHTFRSATPLDYNNFQFNPDYLVPPQNFVVTQAIQYDNTGMPVKVTANNKINSRIYDYNNSLIIADVLNAEQNEIAFTSFEADGKGNWSFAGTPSADIKAITGNKSYVLDNNPISKSLSNTSQNYVVTYWSKNSAAYTVTGTQAGWPQLLYSVNVDGDVWKLYKHIVTGVSTVQISGSGVIDEVRLCPEKARMNSFTHSPLVGITTQSDPNNRIAYNEYDGLGRLVLVRDQDKNIVRKLCYNYTGQPENCSPVMYQNAAYSALLYRNNCAPPLLPSPANVSVPYGQFNSIISQADADAQAAAYAQQLANQQANCNPPIYARMEIFDVEIQDDNEGSETYHAVIADVWVRFYSDAACTQPLTLASPVQLGVRTGGCMDYMTDYDCYFSVNTQTIPAGVHEMRLFEYTSLWGEWMVYDENSNLIYMERWRDYYTLDPVYTNCGISGSYIVAPLPPGY